MVVIQERSRRVSIASNEYAALCVLVRPKGAHCGNDMAKRTKGDAIQGN